MRTRIVLGLTLCALACGEEKKKSSAGKASPAEPSGEEEEGKSEGKSTGKSAGKKDDAAKDAKDDLEADGKDATTGKGGTVGKDAKDGKDNLKPIPTAPEPPGPSPAPAPAPSPSATNPNPELGFGLYVASDAKFLLRNTLTPGAPEHDITYGLNGWIPLLGDWDGDGVATIGIYDTTTHATDGTFLLRNSLTQGAPDVTVIYGAKTMKPVVGDWDGDGRDTIGVFDDSQNPTRFLLKNDNTQGAPDITISWGQPGDIPLAGNWDGDAKMEVGVYRPSTAEFYLRKSDGGLIQFTSGHSSFTPVIGDWDRDGFSNVGFFVPATGEWFLLNANGTRTDFTYGNNIPGALFPLAGPLRK